MQRKNLINNNRQYINFWLLRL